MFLIILHQKANAIPYGTSIVNLDVYPVPDLVIEVANRYDS